MIIKHSFRNLFFSNRYLNIDSTQENEYSLGNRIITTLLVCYSYEII